MTTRTLTFVVWAMLAAAAAGLQVAARAARDRVPGLGDVVSVALGPRIVRWLVLAGWVWLGVHVFAR